MAWSPEDRRKFLSALDTTESRLLVFYKYLLYFLIVSVTLLAVAFHHSVAKDAFRDFLRLYGGILYLIFLAWAVGQLFAVRSRQSRGPSGWNAPSPGDPKIAIKFAKEPETEARRFSFQFGSGTPPSNYSAKTVDIGFAASSLADEDKLDEASLAQADAYITTGAGLDTISRLLNHVTKTGVLPNSRCTAPIFRAKSSCEKPQRLRETRLSLPRSQAKVKLRKSLLRLYLSLRRKQKRPSLANRCSLSPRL